MNKLHPTLLLEGLKRCIVSYTRIPLRMQWQQDKAYTAPAAFLPFIGLLIAALSSWPLFVPVFDASLAALFILLTSILLTGAFHEDGFMDSLDGLIGGTDTEERLTIMKDSRLGSYAAIGIWFLLSIKWLLLTKLIGLSDSPYFTLLLWAILHSLARMTPVFIMQKLPYVSIGKSKAKGMIDQLEVSEWILFFLPTLSVSAVIFYGYDWYLGVMLCAFPTLLAWGCGGYFMAKVQGVNGDMLGASEQLSELVLLLAMALYLSGIA